MLLKAGTCQTERQRERCGVLNLTRNYCVDLQAQNIAHEIWLCAAGLQISLTSTNTSIRPRLLICGQEGSGQAHLAPALLYALEGLPVHAIGLPSLLSDASARCFSLALLCNLCSVRKTTERLPCPLTELGKLFFVTETEKLEARLPQMLATAIS